jgi:hypothetical protein
MINNENSKYFKLAYMFSGVHKTIEKTIPANMAIPPNDGVLLLCELLALGWSTKLNLKAKYMITGITANVIKKEVKKAAMY